MMDNALVLFVLVLLPLNLWVTRQLSRPDAEPGAGAIVMSLGIFGLAVLPHLPLPLAVTTRLVAAEAFIIWGILAVSYAVAWRTPAFKIQLAVPANRFAVGTWVAGTSMLTQLLAKSFPLWRSVAVGLTLITVLLWVWSMALALGAFRTVAAAHGRIRTTGLILLTTVATQSVVLLLHDLFPLQTPLSLSFGLIMAGYALYAAGLAFIIAWPCLQKPRWHHLQDWDPDLLHRPWRPLDHWPRRRLDDHGIRHADRAHLAGKRRCIYIRRIPGLGLSVPESLSTGMAKGRH